VAMSILKKGFIRIRGGRGPRRQSDALQMNFGHNANALWGLSHIEIAPAARILDMAAGAGKTSAICSVAPQGRCGAWITAGERGEIGSAQTKGGFFRDARGCAGERHLATFRGWGIRSRAAFETIYFWPSCSMTSWRCVAC
jgi:hypothetical protein